MVIRDSLEPTGNYLPVASPRAQGGGYQTSGYGYPYGSSPRNSGMLPAPRGVSPSMAMVDGGMSEAVMGGGREYIQQNDPYTSPVGNGPGLGRRQGSGGWNPGAGGQGYGGQYAGQGRGQNTETDL